MSLCRPLRRAKGRRDPDRVVEPGRGFGEVPGWRESVTRRFVFLREEGAGRGTGVNLARGSPPDPGKGSLTMEGTSGRHAPRSFTRARARRPRLLSRCLRPARPVRTRTRRAPRTKVRGVRGPRAARQGCQRHGLLGAPRVEQAPGRGSRVKVPVPDIMRPRQTRRSEAECRETLTSLVVRAWGPNPSRPSPRRKPR